LYLGQTHDVDAMCEMDKDQRQIPRGDEAVIGQESSDELTA
jgi:hypothetical protein